MSIAEERVWVGSQSNYEAALAVEGNIVEALKAGKYDDQPDEDGPRLLSVEAGVATITIEGPLMNSDSWMLEMFGATGYPEIREAVLAAASDPSVSQILLNIDSGGGSVSGCDDTAKLIRLVNDRVKPVTAYTDSIMASAAYWLGSSAGEVYAGRAALVGSIGVKATFEEVSKRNEMEGRTVTVIRAGKYKALADRNEPLTEAARAQIEAVVDSMYSVFVEHVAEARGKSYAYTDKTMADGQEFIGKAAAEVGLVDKIMTFDEVIGTLRQKALASLSKSMDNRGNHSGSLSRAVAAGISGEESMGKKALTEADIAALAAAGTVDASVEGLKETVAEAAKAAKEAEAAEAAKAAAEAEAAKAAEAEAAKATEAEAAKAAEAEAAKAAEVAKTNETVQFLMAQIKEKDAELLKAGVETVRLKEKLDAILPDVEALIAIAAGSVNVMSVALNGPAFDSKGATAASVLAEHARLSPTYRAKFPIGGVASAFNDPNQQQAQVDSRRMARIKAAQFNK